MNEVFLKQKLSCQSKMDLSRKGAVDEPIVELIAFINQSSSYFTTSSCSGRIYVFEYGGREDQKKKGCQWLFTSHDVCDITSVVGALEKSRGDASIKFEPFVLHVQCYTLEDARTMHEVAVASGFRNSGITVGKRGKIVVAVRSTHTLEAPLTQDGKLLVDTRYVQFTVELACKKLKENFRRIDLFFDLLKKSLHAAEVLQSAETVQSALSANETITVRPGKTKYSRKAKRSPNVANGGGDVTNTDSCKNDTQRTAEDRTSDRECESLECSNLFDTSDDLEGF